jgi:cytochrome b561
MWKNTSQRYGTVSRLLHWSLALLLVVLFALGWWSTEMSYYDPLYRTVPDLHRALGVLAACLILLRIAWALYNPHPLPAATAQPWERWAARIGHLSLYILMVAIPVSGYLISTADGRGVAVFGLFELPALLPADAGREELAGSAHYFLAFGAAYLVLLHAAAALKHQFIDRDGTLRKMIG